jgi:P-type conjugative transfer protein TrbL
MLKNLIIAVVLILQIGLSFAQNTVKPPASPFLIAGSSAMLREINLKPAGLPNVAGGVAVANTNQMPTIALSNGSMSNQNNNTFTNIASKEHVEQLEPLRENATNNLFESLITPFEEKMNDYSERLVPHTLRLMYMLALLGVASGVFIQLILGGSFKDICTSLFYVFLTLGFTEFLIYNWIGISEWIVQYFKDIATSVTHVNFTPSTILDFAFKYLRNIWDNLGFDLGKSLMYILLAVPTFFMMVRMVAIYLYTILEFILISKLSVIYLAFAGIKYTTGYAKKPLMFCLSCGLKLMFLQLFFGVVLDIIGDFATKQTSINLALVMFASVTILSMLVEKLPHLVDSFIHGTTSSARGGNLQDMTKALKEVGLSTAKMVMKAIEAKKLLEGSENLARGDSQQQRIAKKIEADYENHVAGLIAKEAKQNSTNGLNSSSSSSIAGSYSNSKASGSYGNSSLKSSGAGAGAGGGANNKFAPMPADDNSTKSSSANTSISSNSENTASNLSNQDATSQNLQNSNSSDTMHKAPTTAQMHEQMLANSIATSNSFSQANDTTNKGLASNYVYSANANNTNNKGANYNHQIQAPSEQNKNKQSLLSKLDLNKTPPILHIAGALIKNNFDITKSNKYIEQKLAQRDYAQEQKHAIFDKVSSGNSPRGLKEVEEFLKHGERLQKDRQYEDDFFAYLDMKASITSQAQQAVHDFTQQANSIAGLNAETIDK